MWLIYNDHNHSTIIKKVGIFPTFFAISRILFPSVLGNRLSIVPLVDF